MVGVVVVVLDGGVVARGAVVVVGGEVADEPAGVRSVNVKATKPMSRAATTRPIIIPVVLMPGLVVRWSRATRSRS